MLQQAMAGPAMSAVKKKCLDPSGDEEAGGVPVRAGGHGCRGRWERWEEYCPWEVTESTRDLLRDL